MSPSASAGRRWAWGLAVAMALGVALELWVLAGAHRTASRQLAERRTTVTVLQLVDLVQRAEASGGGEAARATVTRWAPAHPQVVAIRIVQGAQLEASTVPADVGEKAAPRRLAREEKPLFDLAQRLRAAVDTNRQEAASRKAEIEISWGSPDVLELAAPLEHEGSVTGIVLAAVRPATTLAAPDRLVPAAIAVAAIALMFLAAALVGPRRGLAAAIAVVLLLAGLAAVHVRVARGVRELRLASERALAEQMRTDTASFAAILAALGVPASPPVSAAAWDVDAYRRTFGVHQADGSIDEASLAAVLARTAGRLGWVTLLFGGVSLALLLFIGAGKLAALGATLKRHRVAYAYCFPALFGMLVLVFLPFLYGIVLSFTDSNIYNVNKPLAEIWVGLRNYVDILGDFNIATRTASGLLFNYQNVYWTLGITVAWTLSNVAYGVGVGLLLALVLNTKGLFARPIYRVIFILPWAMPNYITALIWKGMFHQQFGVINQVIQMFGGSPVSWFERTSTSFLACLATNAWLSVPFMMVISLGALQSIPADLYEAARVDGASRWHQFKAITLPSLKPALVPAVILSVIWTFNMFNIIYLVSAGEPGHSTEILVTQAYKVAFEQYRYGYAAAYSMVIFAILLIYGTWQNRVTRATEAI